MGKVNGRMKGRKTYFIDRMKRTYEKDTLRKQVKLLESTNRKINSKKSVNANRPSRKLTEE
jgi:hypothetical protein